MNKAGESRLYPDGELTASWWPVPLRVIVGYGFIVHGFAIAALVLGGSSPFSIDGLLRRRPGGGLDGD